MAIFIPSIMFEAMRNKIGNIVFLDGNGGPAIRQLVTPANPQSARQTASRLIVAQISQAWRDTLTDSQRDGWDTLGAATPEVNELGQDVQISGIAAYMRTNIEVLTVGQARIDDAPSDMNVSAVSVSAVALDSSSNEMVFTYPAGYTATDGMLLRLTAPHSPGRSSVQSLLRIAGALEFPLTPVGDSPAVEVLTDLPILVIGDTRTITFQIFNSLNGALSLPLELKLVVI